MNYRPVLNNIPPVVKNLIIINVLFLLATWAMKAQGFDLVEILGMHYPGSDKFHLYQVITYMFMHDPTGIAHIFFNMFALWMFGRVLESVWGPKRFLMYYMITGIGAIALQTLVSYFEFSSLHSTIEAFLNAPSADQFYDFVVNHKRQMSGLIYTNGNRNLYDFSLTLANQWLDQPESTNYITSAGGIMNSFYRAIISTPTIGASGAVFGVLLAFGMLFPNTELMLLFPPIPIKAKYFVIGYGLLELFFGVSGIQGSVAHFAHLGGMLFGFILIKYWNKNTKHFY